MPEALAFSILVSASAFLEEWLVWTPLITFYHQHEAGASLEAVIFEQVRLGVQNFDRLWLWISIGTALVQKGYQRKASRTEGVTLIGAVIGSYPTYSRASRTRG